MTAAVARLLHAILRLLGHNPDRTILHWKADR